MLKIGAFSVSSPVILAPMAGITDRPFRNLASRQGAGLVVSEMVASQDMVRARPSVRAKAEIAAGTGDSAVQIAGREAHWMAEAARMLEGQGAGIIDINMGCPAKKVTNGASGAALMRDPDHAIGLVRAVVAAVTLPVTVKMRLGWDDGIRNAPEIARRAAAEGVQAITVHGRTRCQFYTGAADWQAIRAVVDAVQIPVIANGDIVDLATARAALRASGAAAVMIGRSARGAPWLAGQIGAALSGRVAPATPTGQALAETIAAHYEDQLSFYGVELGMRTARKHLGWYLGRLGGAEPLRRRLMRMDNPGAVRRCILAEIPQLDPCWSIAA